MSSIYFASWDGDILNSGKRFEQQWKDSIPPNVFFYRFRDGTSAWGDQGNTRFQQSNMCDCEMFDGQNLYLLELKSHKGKSLPLSAIRKNQLDELLKASTYKNIVAGFIVNYADVGQTFFIPATNVIDFITDGERKSIPLVWCERFGIKINGILKKVNYKWDVENFILHNTIQIPTASPKYLLEQTEWD